MNNEYKEKIKKDYFNLYRKIDSQNYTTSDYMHKGNMAYFVEKIHEEKYFNQHIEMIDYYIKNSKLNSLNFYIGEKIYKTLKADGYAGDIDLYYKVFKKSHNLGMLTKYAVMHEEKQFPIWFLEMSDVLKANSVKDILKIFYLIANKYDKGNILFSKDNGKTLRIIVEYFIGTEYRDEIFDSVLRSIKCDSINEFSWKMVLFGKFIYGKKIKDINNELKEKILNTYELRYFILKRLYKANQLSYFNILPAEIFDNLEPLSNGRRINLLRFIKS